MTLVIELPPELERELREAADLSGREPETLAREALAEKLASLRNPHKERRRRQLALLERWDAEDGGRTDDLPAPEIPRISLRTPGSE